MTDKVSTTSLANGHAVDFDQLSNFESMYAILDGVDVQTLQTPPLFFFYRGI